MGDDANSLVGLTGLGLEIRYWSFIGHVNKVSTIAESWNI
jgi:hypothetical protein